jgi:hypothetical protein
MLLWRAINSGPIRYLLVSFTSCRKFRQPAILRQLPGSLRLFSARGSLDAGAILGRERQLADIAPRPVQHAQDVIGHFEGVAARDRICVDLGSLSDTGGALLPEGGPGQRKPSLASGRLGAFERVLVGEFEFSFDRHAASSRIA